jgi:hypothetical protein
MRSCVCCCHRLVPASYLLSQIFERHAGAEAGPK